MKKHYFFHRRKKRRFFLYFHYDIIFCCAELFECTFNFNPLSANLTKWSDTLKQFVGKLPTNCLIVFDHFVRLALKGLNFD